MKHLLLSLAILALSPASMQAQRIYQKLGRGVVAVTRSSGNECTVSWRKLTNDPDSCTYNIYKRAKGTESYTKINATPLRGTSIKLKGSQLPYNYEVAVTTVTKDGTESAMSAPFLYSKKPYANEWMHIEFDNNVLKRDEYSTKYVWPCDLDGDGEMDEFIVDRLGSGAEEEVGDDDDTSGTTTATAHKLQAYDIDGTLLWTIALGPNVNICSGQNDMVTVCDIDCDGKAEVIIKSSDGTRFWDKANETWGKYVFGKTTGDVDGDGIIDYCASTNTKRNPPFYISVIDGLTGEEKVSAELKYSEVTDGEDTYTRDNKDSYMSNNGYYQMVGHFAICYDGVRPYVAMKCLDRDTNGKHHDYIFAFGYDWVNGKPTNFRHFYTWSRNDKTPWPAEFHGNRVADVDGDGIDELCPGAFAVNPWKDMVSSPGVGHGDRFTYTDIDPERPGMEAYGIQQSDLLGQLIWDAATGERVKEWYLSSVFDVGRGVCCDVDSTRLGLENYSFVSDYIYDCHGKKTDVKRPYPQEPIWWDGDLMREALSQIGGNGRGSNMIVAKLPNSSRFINFGSESSWAVHGQTGSRPGFWGDIFGDWREEVILFIQNDNTSTGIAGYATELTSDKTITALYEDGHYRGDCSARGYYQSPNTSFYLATGMPQEPIYDCVETDLRWKGGAFDGGFTSFDQKTTAAFAYGKSVIFDISGDNSSDIAINKAVTPSSFFLMNPKGHDYRFSGTGKITGDVVIKKGMQGKATFGIDIASTAKAVISEGTLESSAAINCPLYIMARGTLAGTTTVNAPVYFEGALNYEGCRLMPGSADDRFGTMTFNNGLTLPGKVYIETTLSTAEGKAAIVKVNGDLTLKGINYFTIDCTDTDIKAGSYTLAECTGTLTADAANIKVRNLNGVPYRIQTEANKIVLTIDSQRKPAEDVLWKGSTTTEWDYLTKNFSANGEDSYFVTGDKVVFDDSADNFNVSLNNTVMAGSIEFRNDEKTYTFTGDGSISGTGDLIKNGKGEVRLLAEESNFTGRTIINEGRLTVSKMANAGKTSSIGAPVADKGYLQINGAELAIDGDNVATDRMITITDTCSLDVVNAGSGFTMNSQISGEGVLVKQGDGQLNFSYAGENAFSAIVVRQGRINQGSWKATFGKAGCPMYLEGGSVSLIANNGMTTTPNLNHQFYAKEGTASNIIGSFRSNITGAAHGKGTIQITSGGARCYVSTDFSDFEGTLVGSGAELLLTDKVTDMKRATLNPTGSCGVSPAASTLSIGTLTSNDKEAAIGGTTVNAGYLNQDSKFAGIIKCKSFYKYGTGTLTLTGTSSTAGIYVKEGALKLSNISGNCTSASITVDSGTLTGNGYTQSILAKNGATIAPGNSDSATGTLNTTGNIICYGKTTLVFKASTATNDKVKAKGTLRLTGDTIRIRPINGRTFAEGDEIQLFEAGTFYAGSKWIIVDDTYLWDDSQLISKGILTCKGNATGIKGVSVNEPDNVRFFTTDGKEVNAANLPEHRTYIRRTVKGGKVETIVINK